ncbi:MAG: outer membrane lipoprotein LolB [Massilia sp.]
MQVKKIMAAGLCAALLGGCASLAPTSSTVGTGPLAPYQDQFETAGRLSINYKHNGNPESLSGKFTWKQAPARLDVTLSSPLATIATITVTPESATLVQSDKAPKVAADLDTLTAQSLGWTLPVTGLRDWLQGYATAADGSRFTASAANNTVTTRDGWRLRYVSFQNDAAGRPAPRRIDAERTGAANVDELALRIVLDSPL